MKAPSLLLLLLMAPTLLGQHGQYIGAVVTRWDPDGRSMILTEPFAYVDPSGVRWDAPVGSKVDGASIPRIAWTLVGGPFEGKYRESSVIHDVACVEKRRAWDVVHNAFYTAMLASGVPVVKAKVMYAAVYHFGPRWPTRVEIRHSVPETVFQQECAAGPLGVPICSSRPVTKMREVATVIEMLPEPQELTEEALASLAAEIEESENGATPVSLQQIQRYQVSTHR